MRPWRHVRSSLFTNSSKGCCCETHRSGIHCDESPTSLHPPSATRLSSLLSSHHISAEKWDSPCHEDWWSPLTSATEALGSKIASEPFCLSSFEASHILCSSAVDFEHAPVPVLIGRHISRATWGGDRSLQVCSKYAQRAYPKGKLNSTVVIDLLSSLGLYTIGLGACDGNFLHVGWLWSHCSGEFQSSYTCKYDNVVDVSGLNIHLMYASGHSKLSIILYYEFIEWNQMIILQSAQQSITCQSKAHSVISNQLHLLNYLILTLET